MTDIQGSAATGGTEIGRMTVAGKADMRAVIEDARKASAGAGKSGSAAGLMRNHALMADGTNHVKLYPDPTRHAEIVAIGRISQQLATGDLSERTLLSALQPCEMCFATARFARINRTICAARQDYIPEKYFAFPHLPLDDFQSGLATFDAIGGVVEAQVLDLYRDARK